MAEWRAVRIAELLFAHRDAARLTASVLIAISAAVLIARLMLGRRPGRNRRALPAILRSISLIDDLTEFNKFPDHGTTIGMAINQAVHLFTAFDFLNASGNLMVIFSDGEDTKVNGPRLGNMNVDEILGGAAKAKIPV